MQMTADGGSGKFAGGRHQLHSLPYENGDGSSQAQQWANSWRCLFKTPILEMADPVQPPKRDNEHKQREVRLPGRTRVIALLVELFMECTEYSVNSFVHTVLSSVILH